MGQHVFYPLNLFIVGTGFPIASAKIDDLSELPKYLIKKTQLSDKIKKKQLCPRAQLPVFKNVYYSYFTLL